MKKLISISILLLIEGICWSAGKINPVTGRYDLVGDQVVLSSSTLPPGSTNYIQNTLSPTTTTQQFSVHTASVTQFLYANSSATINGPLIQSGTGGTAGHVLTSNGSSSAPTWKGIAVVSSFTYTFTPLQVVASSGTLGIQNSTTTRPMLLYDASAHEWADWQSIQLAPYIGGTLNAEIAFTMASATSGGVTWCTRVEAITTGDSADYDTASFDVCNSTSGAQVPATAGYLKVVTVPLTSADSAALNDSFRIRVERLPADSGDTASGDAELRWVRIHE